MEGLSDANLGKVRKIALEFHKQYLTEEFSEELVTRMSRNNFKVYHLHSNFCEHTSGNVKLVHYFEFVHVGSRWTIDVDGAYNTLKETVFSIIKEYNLEYNPKPLICDKEWHHN